MERGKENEGETEKKGDANNSLVSSVVLRKDIVNLLDFIERLNNGCMQISVLDVHQIEDLTLELTFVSAFLHRYYFSSEGCNAEMSCISNEIHDLVQSLFHQSEEDMLLKLTDHDVPLPLENIRSYISSHSYAESSVTMTEDHLVELLDDILMYLQLLPKGYSDLIFPLRTQYEFLQNVYGNLRDFHGLKVNGCVEYETIEYVLPQLQLMAQRIGNFCFTLLDSLLDELDDLDVFQVISKLANLLVEVIPVELEVMHICSTNLKASKSAEVGRFVKQLLEASPDILRESLIHLQEHMVNAITPTTSSCNIHVMIEFLLIILTDVPKDVIRHDKLFVLLARVEALTKEVFVLVCNLEENSKNGENMNETWGASLNMLENIELLKEDLKNVFLKPRADSSQLCFPMSDGPLYMTLLLSNLNDLLNSNAYSVALIKEEIGQVKEDLEFIKLFFGNFEQELNRDLWTRILDVAYEAELAIKSILARDHGLLQLIVLLPNTIEKIKLIKEKVEVNISKNRGLIVANSPNKPTENKSSTAGKIIVGFEEETKWIIRKLTSGPAEVDVISIVGMPGIGKTTLAYRVYNDKSVVDHFDVRAWCTVDQERNEKKFLKLLQKIFNQVVGLKERFSEDGIDDDVADKLRKQLFGKRYLIVLDDLWDTATWDELTRPFPEFQKRSRIILTSRIKEVALHGKRHNDPLYLRLFTLGESWELLEKRVFGEERCPDELLHVGEEIARKCDGLPLVLDLIGGVIARKEKKEDLWLEVLNNLKSFIFKDEEEVMKVIQLSYDHLSDRLKPCLLYFANFPKDEYIAISDLKYLWCAEGLVEQTEMKVSVDELISSSLVLVYSERGAYPSCQIHDLVHDFCSRKARKEKLCELISSMPSSDLMPRGLTIHCDLFFPYLDGKFVLFNAEKENPYVKHLLSLKVFDRGLHLSNTLHLRHLRLLKSLVLPNISLTEFLLNEIGMLVHLKFLNILMEEATALPPSFSNLCNLETLVVYCRWGTCMGLSPIIWSLKKLRDVRMNRCFINEPTVLEEDSKSENLKILYQLYLSGLEDTKDIFKRFPNLQTLGFRIKRQPDCSPEMICFPRLDVLNELEELCVHVSWDSFSEYTQGFPSTLKKLDLKGLALTSDLLSRIVILTNLENLSLTCTNIQGKEWNMEEVAFQNLKSLKLDDLSFSEWQVIADESFPVLEALKIRGCTELIEIPDSFGDIASLKSISVFSSPQLKESALKIREYVAEMTGEDKLEVQFEAKWSHLKSFSPSTSLEFI